MKNTISFDVNNGGKMKLIQREHNGSCLITTEDEKEMCNWTIVKIVDTF